MRGGAPPTDFRGAGNGGPGAEGGALTRCGGFGPAGFVRLVRASPGLGRMGGGGAVSTTKDATDPEGSPRQKFQEEEVRFAPVMIGDGRGGGRRLVFLFVNLRAFFVNFAVKLFVPRLTRTRAGWKPTVHVGGWKPAVQFGRVEGGDRRGGLEARAPAARSHSGRGQVVFSTWAYSSSTGVARPKIETVTRRRARSSSTCSTEPLKLAKGPSITRTDSPISN